MSNKKSRITEAVDNCARAMTLSLSTLTKEISKWSNFRPSEVQELMGLFLSLHWGSECKLMGFLKSSGLTRPELNAFAEEVKKLVVDEYYGSEVTNEKE